MSSVVSGGKPAARVLWLFQDAFVGTDLLDEDSSGSTPVTAASIQLLLGFNVDHGCAWVSFNEISCHMLACQHTSALDYECAFISMFAFS